jgi:hypothetical protein
MMSLTFHDKKESFTIQTNRGEGNWLVGALEKTSIGNIKITNFQDLKSDFETHFQDFELFWYSRKYETRK